jgi:hypothetical protein
VKVVEQGKDLKDMEGLLMVAGRMINVFQNIMISGFVDFTVMNNYIVPQVIDVKNGNKQYKWI